MLFLLIPLLLVAVVIYSQWTAHTPAILGADGKNLPGSIASLEKVKLGGVDQWLIIRGHDVNKPVLLFLSGGPGASESARVLRFNSELEKHFVVVIWEQRGCGKSYPSLNPKSDLTIDQYVSDVIELSELLRVRFKEQKIYLVGHSWGTIIGALAAQQRSDLFHAYIGTAQMVDVRATDQMIYDLVLEHSIQTGDTDFAQTLEKQGPPPYFGKSPIKPYATLFGREYQFFEVPNIKDETYRREGRPVFVNFTAAWCVTCLVNEKIVLRNDAVWAAMNKKGVVAMKADWTRRDAAITRALAALGRNGVPVYALYTQGTPPALLPRILTEQAVLAELATLPDRPPLQRAGQ